MMTHGVMLGCADACRWPFEVDSAFRAMQAQDDDDDDCFLVVENSKKKTLFDDKCKFPKEAKLLVELVVSYLLISTFHL